MSTLFNTIKELINKEYKEESSVNEVFNMNDPVPTNLKMVAQQKLNKHGEMFMQEFKDGDVIYFHPVYIQKNGGLVGAVLTVSGGRIGKSKQVSVPKTSFDLWKHVEKNDYPKKVLDKMDDTLKKLFKDASN